MTPTLSAGPQSAIRTLRRMATRRAQVEACEFCRAILGPAHRHLLESETRRLACVCDPCALRFENVIGRWKLIPRDAIPLTDFKLSDEEWEGFALPINLAFFVHSGASGKVVALYPSPAGATESLLSMESWSALVAANSVLGQMQADVQALLVNRLGTSRDYYLMPIDRCFELAGLIRLHWRGFSGGAQVWKEIEAFFEKVRALKRRPSGTLCEEGTWRA